ncbi:MAG: hypothetical protein JWN84_3490 [Nocardioides sp.]|nr:hypothetical protein [Nocardioides sp.]
MADDDLDGLDRFDDALLQRVRSGVSGIHPRHDALAVVQHQVGRRRRRRRVVTAVASVAAAAVAVPAVLVALQVGGGDTVEPAVPDSTETIDGTRPAAFFVANLGGRSRGQLTRYRAAAGERYYARFLWWPEVDAEGPVFAGAAVEAYDAPAADACAEVVAADEAAGLTASCETRDDGVVMRVADGTGPLAVDAVNRRGRLDNAQPTDAVRSVTAFRTDGWAVSLVVCACVAWERDDLSAPPLSGAELADAATVQAWVPEPEGSSD